MITFNVRQYSPNSRERLSMQGGRGDWEQEEGDPQGRYGISTKLITCCEEATFLYVALLSTPLAQHNSTCRTIDEQETSRSNHPVLFAIFLPTPCNQTNIEREEQNFVLMSPCQQEVIHCSPYLQDLEQLLINGHVRWPSLHLVCGMK